ncbi:hypothetical protein GJ629_04530 [Halapricum sp. CBA1109]|uniref:hypothetical protein n=1 Tax=Halapricum sp. CBA1109 TaxID=2668068 RepID=UPI0012F76E38|nr:hypothetical protein [Halapricum sp. CBA1109]MUV89254.1 hypothetical protein [Halapricum sp. CBA1109]
MAPVIDLSGGGEKRVSDIESSGLAGTPVTETVGPDEEVRYGLVSKRGDVTVERDGETTEHTAGRGYRTVTAVTDVRLLVVVGGDDGGDDRVVSIPVEAIDTVETHQSFLSGGLRIETAGGEKWSIPCKGDLDGVVEFVRTATRAWRRATGSPRRPGTYSTTPSERWRRGTPTRHLPPSTRRRRWSSAGGTDWRSTMSEAASRRWRG